MSETKVRGKDLLIKRPPMALFGAFSDLSRFVSGLPEKYRAQVSATADSITFNYNGISLGIVVENRVPFSLVSLRDDGKSPFPFGIDFNMEAVGLDSTLFHIELKADLNPMIRMMIGNKLQEMVDTMTDQIEKAMEGQAPDMEDFKKEYFS